MRKPVLVLVLAAAVAIFRGTLAGGAVASASEPESTNQPAAGGVAAQVSDGDGRKEKARRLFDQGQTFYSLGEYDRAIASFREAYELSSAPGLLFNLAQAHRLNGECRRALELYRHFVRLAPDSPQAREAQKESRNLEGGCSAAQESAAAAVLPAKASPAAAGSIEQRTSAVAAAPAAPAETAGETTPDRWSNRTRVAVALLATGLTVGVGTGMLYWWNDTRYKTWSDEDRRLAAGPDAAPSSTEWASRQERNDAFLRSIWSVDKTVISLGVLSAACLVASATLGILSLRGAHVAIGPREISLAWPMDLPRSRSVRTTTGSP